MANLVTDVTRTLIYSLIRWGLARGRLGTPVEAQKRKTLGYPGVASHLRTTLAFPFET